MKAFVTFQTREQYEYVKDQLKTLKRNAKYNFSFNGEKTTISWEDTNKSRIIRTYNWIWKRMLPTILDMPKLVIEK